MNRRRTTHRSGASLTAWLLATALTLGPAVGVTQSAQDAAPATGPSPLGVLAPRGPMLQPISTLVVPVEIAALSSRVDLQFSYTRLSFGRRDFNSLALSLDAQYAIHDALEVGLTIPLLTHAFTALGQLPLTDVTFGNVAINLKGKLYGRSDGPFAVSLYTNTTLPTNSHPDINERGFVGIHSGVSATGHLSMLTMGIGTGVYAWVLPSPSPNIVLYLFDFFVGAMLHPMVGLQIAFQVGAPIHPSGGEAGFAALPGVKFFPTPNVHLDLAARIGNTSGRAYTGGGTAALIFSGGYQF